jgi:uncharacterized membrane protein YqaE (UPF0057 family)
MSASRRSERRALAWVAAISTAAAAMVLSLPPLRVLIEQGMAWHMVVQMPLLAAAGWLASRAVHMASTEGADEGSAQRVSADTASATRSRRWPPVNRLGLTGFMAVQCIAAYWMLPSAIDRAVVLPMVDAAKIASLFAAGWWLRNAFRLAPPAVQLFFAGTTLPMAVWLGSYLASTDLRLCNAYSLESQVNAGRGLVALAIGAGLAWAVHLRGWIAQRS